MIVGGAIGALLAVGFRRAGDFQHQPNEVAVRTSTVGLRVYRSAAASCPLLGGGARMRQERAVRAAVGSAHTERRKGSLGASIGQNARGDSGSNIPRYRVRYAYAGLFPFAVTGIKRIVPSEDAEA